MRADPDATRAINSTSCCCTARGRRHGAVRPPRLDLFRRILSGREGQGVHSRAGCGVDAQDESAGQRPAEPLKHLAVALGEEHGLLEHDRVGRGFCLDAQPSGEFGERVTPRAAATASVVT